MTTPVIEIFPSSVFEGLQTITNYLKLAGSFKSLTDAEAKVIMDGVKIIADKITTL